MISLPMTFLAIIWLVGASHFAVAEVAIQPLRSVYAAEAHQAVAVDATSYYATSNQSIARYDKSFAKRLADRYAPTQPGVKHFNRGLVFDGRLYCASSHWRESQPLDDAMYRSGDERGLRA